MRAEPLPSLLFRMLLAAAITVAVASVPVTAAAAPQGDQAAVEKVTTLNKKALDAYAKQDYEAARSTLKEALQVCANSGLDTHPITARTHIHFGVVAIVGFKQRPVGIKQFRKALEIQPDIKLTKTLVTPELQEAFEEAVLAGEGGGGAAAGGGDESGGGGAPSVQADDGDGDATSPRRPKAPPPRKKRPGDDDDDKDDSGQKGVFFIAIAAGTGFGLASGNGALDPYAHKLSSAGFAMAQAAHVAPEVGFFLSPDLLISAALRLQYVTGVNGKTSTSGCGSDNFCTPKTTAEAGFLKATYLLGGSPRFTIGGQIGGGYIRHAVVFANDKTCKPSATYTGNPQTCVDTLNGGPFLIGPTAGVMFELGSAANLMLNVNTALGLPNFTFNIDVQAGFAFRL